MKIAPARGKIFAAESVLAIHAGIKTQTRRLVTAKVLEAIEWLGGGPVDLTTPGAEPEPATADSITLRWGSYKGDSGKDMPAQWLLYSAEYPEEGCIPLGTGDGNVGDLLWVRETCRAQEDPITSIDGVLYLADGAWRAIENTKAAAEAWVDLNHYCHTTRKRTGTWVPPMHMPRWAARTLLRITAVRFERLQDITEAEAVAEGYCQDELPYFMRNSAKVWYQDLWGKLHGATGPDSWSANPWVRVTTFEVVKGEANAEK